MNFFKLIWVIIAFRIILTLFKIIVGQDHFNLIKLVHYFSNFDQKILQLK